jgi:hypothetical protein
MPATAPRILKKATTAFTNAPEVLVTDRFHLQVREYIALSDPARNVMAASCRPTDRRSLDAVAFGIVAGVLRQAARSST